MGDRALVHFTDGDTISPAVYLHWSGSEVPELLSALRVRMGSRTGDEPYAAARFCGIAHERISGATSLGILPAPNGPAEIVDPEYSHGDAGIFLVNVNGDTWRADCFNGYGFHGIDGANSASSLGPDFAVLIGVDGKVTATTPQRPEVPA